MNESALEGKNMGLLVTSQLPFSTLLGIVTVGPNRKERGLFCPKAQKVPLKRPNAQEDPKESSLLPEGKFPDVTHSTVLWYFYVYARTRTTLPPVTRERGSDVRSRQKMIIKGFD